MDPTSPRTEPAPPSLKASWGVDLATGATVGRYRIRQEIGRGGMGAVYEAEERGTGAVVAIKVVLPHLLEVESFRDRFHREARLGLLVAHENVVRTLALEEASVEGRRLHFLVMERVRGRTLRRLLEEMRVVPEALWREIAIQGARGLAALHDAGVVHRDLKPENLLLADDRRVRIMDLGIAKPAAGGGTFTSAGVFVGSMRYAAPEQGGGREVGPPADLYSFGVTLYELATGRPPFDSDDPVALLRAHAEVTAVPASDRNPALSEFASDVVATLLAKRPGDRFASAKELARVLEDGESGEWWTSRRRASRTPRPRRAEAPPPVRLVGREPERDALVEAWRLARGGEGGVALVTGEGGIGKTRLVQELAASLADEQALVLRSGFSPTGATVSLGAALLAHLDAGALEGDLVRRLEVAIGPAMAIAAHLRGKEPVAGVEPLGARELEAQLVRLLRSLEAQSPVLWVIEDLHFADGEARRAVLALARSVEHRRVLLVVTTRPGLDPDLLGSLGLLSSLTRVDLGRLDESEVGALIAAALRDTALGLHLARPLARRADGIPFFVLEMLRDLEQRGHLVRGADGLLHEGTPLRDLDAPRALADLVRGRLSRLSAEERATLEVAAVEGYEFDPAHVAHARGRTRLEVLDVLGRLESVYHLVRSGPRLGRFDHHLLQEVVYGDLSPALRSEWHARLADAIESSPPGDDAAVRARRVVAHRLRGPEPERALPLAAAAIRQCESAHRYDEAYDLAVRALEASKGGGAPADRVGLLDRLADLSMALGRPGDLRGLLDEALAIARTLADPALVGQVRIRRGAVALRDGRFADALDEGRAAVVAFREGRREQSAVEALSLSGRALWCLGRHAESRAVQEEALAAATSLPASVLARVASDLGIVLHEMGRFAEAELHLRAALDVMRQADDRRNLGAVTSNLGNVLHDIGRKAEALACYEEAAVNDRLLGQRHGEAVTWVNIGESRLRLGDVAGAREAFRLCEDLAREVGEPRVEAYALHGLGHVAWWAGSLVEARRRLHEALALRRRIGHRPGIADTCLALGALEAEAGDHAAALALLDESATLARAVDDPTTLSLATIRRAIVAGEDVAPAARLFEEAGARVRHDGRIEGHWLLWKATGDPAHAAAARRLVDVSCSNAPPAARAAMVEHVPLFREIVAAPGRSGPSTESPTVTMPANKIR